MPIDRSGVEALRRARAALEAVLPASAPLIDAPTLDDHGADFLLAGQPISVKWLDGTDLHRVRAAIDMSKPRPDLLIAPRMSPASRKLASEKRVGWIDESGDAEFAIGSVVVARTGSSAGGAVTERGYGQAARWTAAATATAEALLTGVPATVSALAASAAVPASTAALALKFLERQHLLQAPASRGRKAGRVVRDRDALLSAYAMAVAATQSKASLHVAVLWRDPVAAVADLGGALEAMGVPWAVTGALTAAVRAPFSTQIAPLVVYVDAFGVGALRSVAESLQLPVEPAGRLTLAVFPSPTTAVLSAPVGDGLRSVSWPRAYADLSSTGVRGEEVAEHLKDVVGER